METSTRMNEEQKLQEHHEPTAQQEKNENDWLAFISSVSANLGSSNAQALPALTNALSNSSTSNHSSPPLPSVSSLSNQPSSSFHPPSESHPNGSSSSHGFSNDPSSGLVDPHPRQPSSSSSSNQHHAMSLAHQIAFPPVYDPSLHLHYPISSQQQQQPNNSNASGSSTSMDQFIHTFFPPATAFTPPPPPPLFSLSQTNSNSMHHPLQFHHQTAFNLPASFHFNSPDPTPASSTSTSPHPQFNSLPSSSHPPAPSKRAKSFSSTKASTGPSRGRSTSSAGPARTRESRSTSSPTGSIQEVELNDATEGGEVDEVEEDKRRRNTEASARFRAKKKAKAINLTRTVSDLNGRVQDLEVEAGELRSENKWLKQLVLTKAQNGGGSV
ncbi:hypothetical protein BDY24DRAFT_436993 [Mrakia frigida]|uniref:bZIP transcription factor n=1 Tax=Mrakia frigida TaxID=29902 RepID=UPI003FCBFF4A